MKTWTKAAVALAVFLAIIVVRIAIRVNPRSGEAPTGPWHAGLIADIAYGFIALLVLWFVLVAWRDLARLLTARDKLGLGIKRVWAVARHAMQEAWAARVWAVVILWAIAAAILLALTKNYDDTERVPNYLFILLRSQEFVVLVFVTVLACFSLPRERERKTIITTGSKPLSRLELFLGKVVGFLGVALGLLLVMGLLSWLFLTAVDSQIRGWAQEKIALRERDYDLKARRAVLGTQPATDRKEAEEGQESLESLRQLRNEGTLWAYNYISVPKGGMQVAGQIDFRTTPPTRYLKGGSQERLIYRFPRVDPKTGMPLMIMDPSGTVRADMAPVFVFQYHIMLGARSATDFVEPPQELPLQVTAMRSVNRLRQQERTLRARPVPGSPSIYRALWQPERPDELFAFVDPRTSEVGEGLSDVEVQVTCPLPGVYLRVEEPEGSVPGSNLYFSPIYASGRAIQCPTSPRLYGFEKRDKQQFAGPDDKALIPLPGEFAVWRFEKVKRSDLPVKRDKDGRETFTISLKLDVEKRANYERPSMVGLRVRRQHAAQAEIWDTQVAVVEKRVMPVEVPTSVLGASSEDLIVYLQAQVPGHWIGADDSSVRLEQRRGLFVVNLLKSELIIFIEVGLLALVAVTCSIRLGGPVAALTTGVIYVLGFLQQFVGDLQSVSGMGMLGFNPPVDPGAGFRLADGLMALMFKILNILVHLLPDFSRYDPTVYILESRNIPFPILGWHMVWLAIWTVPFVAVGYLLIRKQELA